MKEDEKKTPYKRPSPFDTMGTVYNELTDLRRENAELKHKLAEVEQRTENTELLRRITRLEKELRDVKASSFDMLRTVFQKSKGIPDH